MATLTVELDDHQLRILCEVAAWWGTTPEACLDQIVVEWIRFWHESDPDEEPFEKPPCDAAGASFPVALDDALTRMLHEMADRHGVPLQACFDRNTWQALAFAHELTEDGIMERTSLVEENGASCWWVTGEIVKQWAKDMTALQERSLRYRPHSRMWREG